MSGVAANGETTPFGTGSGAHYLSVRHVCEADTPLTYGPVSTVHVTNGGGFTLGSRTSTISVPNTLSVSSGVVSSSTGSIY